MPGPGLIADNHPLVSVVVPTYQHAAYIAECLEGILMQRTDFPVEILLGEDDSSDGTRAICQHYATMHPGRIRLFLRSRKDVIHINGTATGRANLLGPVP
jgi:glycosyltransferase involved in cell wall biosynthesis